MAISGNSSTGFPRPRLTTSARRINEYNAVGRSPGATVATPDAPRDSTVDQSQRPRVQPFGNAPVQVPGTRILPTQPNATPGARPAGAPVPYPGTLNREPEPVGAWSSAGPRTRDEAEEARGRVGVGGGWYRARAYDQSGELQKTMRPRIGGAATAGTMGHTEALAGGMQEAAGTPRVNDEFRRRAAEAQRGQPLTGTVADSGAPTASSTPEPAQDAPVYGTSNQHLQADTGEDTPEADDTGGTAVSNVDIGAAEAPDIIATLFTTDSGYIRAAQSMGLDIDPGEWEKPTEEWSSAQWDAARYVYDHLDEGADKQAVGALLYKRQKELVDNIATQSGVTDPGQRQLVQAMDNDPRWEVDSNGNIVDSDSRAVLGHITRPDEWTGDLASARDRYYQANPAARPKAEDRGGKYRQLLDELGDPMDSVDPIDTEGLIAAQRAQRAAEMARTIRASMEAGGRAGMGPEAMTGLQAGVQQQSQLEGATADENTRLQSQIQNSQQAMEAWRMRSSQLMQLASMEQDMAIKEMLIKEARTAEARSREHERSMMEAQLEAQTEAAMWSGIGGGLGSIVGGLVGKKWG